MLQLLLHRLDLAQARDVALASVEARLQKRPDEVGGQLGADDLRAQAEHVQVVVLDALVRRVGVVADRGPDSGELAGRDGGSDARAADEDPALGPAVRERGADLARLVRIVDPPRIRVGAEIDELVPSPRRAPRARARAA